MAILGCFIYIDRVGLKNHLVKILQVIIPFIFLPFLLTLPLFTENYPSGKRSTLAHSPSRIATSPKIFSHDYFRVGENEFKKIMLLLEVFLLDRVLTELCLYMCH